MVELEIGVWWKHYLFMLITISMIYPKYPNTLIKKKYYDFIHHTLPLFIPNQKFINYYNKLLNKYPVITYLDNNTTLCKWIWFINNKVNVEFLEKPKIPLSEFYTIYYDEYNTYNHKNTIYYNLKEKVIWIGVFILLLGLLGYGFYRGI